MPAEPHPDAIAAARVGAGWAFERIYHCMAPDVLGYLRSQGCADPEDSANAVFFRAFRNMGSFDGSGTQFRSWLFAIAHNLVIDERRMASRRPATQPLHDRFDRAAGDVEADAMSRLASGRVRQMLSLLSPDQRDVLLLRIVADLSLEEVAVATGRTVGAVKSLQHRALAALRRRLDEVAPEPIETR